MLYRRDTGIVYVNDVILGTCGEHLNAVHE